MITTQAKPVRTKPIWWRILKAALSIVIVAAVVGYIMRQSATALEKDTSPAGFVRGMVQGALMPCALPNLLVGTDVSIYNENNTGVRYKLGYTCGVNACGAIFFGIMFLRLNRWRKRVQQL